MWAPWKPQGGDWTPGAAPMKAQPMEKLKDTLVTGSASSARPFLFKRASLRRTAVETGSWWQSGWARLKPTIRCDLSSVEFTSEEEGIILNRQLWGGRRMLCFRKMVPKP